MKAQSLKVTAASAAVAAGLGAVAACGSSVASPADGGQVAAPAASAKLQVLESVPGGQTRRWSLRCEPAGGTVPDAAAACRLLTTDTTILRPSPATHIMCRKATGGARTFTITGTWRGKKVREVVADGGCELRRWSQMAQIFY
jgi:Subtilisin inhibitor-like